MKRKIFSKLLMVALVIAAVGSFVSCKDYDDDINNLQKQIDAKAALSELTALQSTLEGKISTATAAAQKAAEDAAAKADASLKTALETAIADAKKAGTDAGTQAGTAIAAANKAQETADAAAQAAKDADAAAKAALADALKTIEETYQTKAEAAAAATEAAKALADVKAIADAAYTKAQAEELKAELDGLKESLESSIDEKIAAAIAELGNAGASVAAIWSAITNVEIFGTFTGNDYKVTDAGNALRFYHGVQVDNVFGDANETLSYVATDAKKEYKAGDSIQVDNRILVHVTPSNATFTKDQIQILNSLGENLNDYVEVLSVEPFKGLITRADATTGLYIVTVAAKAATTDADLAKVSHGNEKVSKKDKQQRDGTAAFALAINNTEDAAADRWATSSYDMVVNYGYYRPASVLTFDVNGKNVYGYANRWDGAKVIAEDETKANGPVDYLWAASKNYPAPAVELVINDDDATKANVGNGDIRYGNPRLVLESFDDDIKINGFANNVQWYYVTLDKENAIESKPSEFNAWKKYEISNLNTMTPASSTLILNVNSEVAKGDIIGFRVYGVNYDGTLADPDGVAFYVELGKPAAATTATVTGTFKAVSTAGSVAALDIVKDAATSNSALIDVEEVFAGFGLADDISLVEAGLAATATPSANSLAATQSKTANKKTIAADANVQVYYLKSKELKDGAVQFAETVNETKYIAVAVADASNVVDTKTITTDPINVVNIDNHKAKVATFSIVLTKGAVASKDPNAATPFSWKTGYYKDGVATIYPNIDEAQKTWNNATIFAASDPVAVPLSLFANNVPTTVKEATLTFDGKKMTVQTDTISYTAATAQFTIDAQWIGENSLIGGKHTAHLKLVTESGAAADKLSRVQKTTVTSISDAKNDTQTKAPDFTAVDADIVFANILDYQVYSNDKFYWDGAVGAVGVKKANTLWGSWAAITASATGKNLRYAYDFDVAHSAATALGEKKIGWVDAGTGKVTKEAEDGFAAGNTARPALADLLTASKNTAVETFAAGAFDPALYTTDATKAPTAKVVTVASGNENEYVKLLGGNNPLTQVSLKNVGTTGPASAKEALEYQVTVYDIFGQKHQIVVPFDLLP